MSVKHGTPCWRYDIIALIDAARPKKHGALRLLSAPEGLQTLQKLRPLDSLLPEIEVEATRFEPLSDQVSTQCLLSSNQRAA